MRRRQVIAGGLAATGALALPTIRAGAQTSGRYPDRPVRIIVPFPAGGGTDTWARMVVEGGLQAELGVPVVIENRGGSAGLIGSDVVAKAPPDGYTLLYNITTLVQAPVVLKQFPHDPIKDFSFIGRLGTTAVTFTVGPAVPASVRTFQEFVAWGKGRQLAFGNYGPGSTGHAFAVLLAQETGLNATQVAYRGEAPMLQDNLGGQFHGGFHSTIVAGEMIKAGRLRPLATGGPDRVPSLADRVPTMLELGYSQRFAFSGFTGLFGPARLPPEVMDKLVPAFRRTVTAPAFVERLKAIDTIPGYEDPQAFRASCEQTLRQWQELADALDLYSTG
jgi:tripartite-type tricarboxylate transporter receptor subunit TctC